MRFMSFWQNSDFPVPQSPSISSGETSISDSSSVMIFSAIGLRLNSSRLSKVKNDFSVMPISLKLVFKTVDPIAMLIHPATVYRIYLKRAVTLR